MPARQDVAALADRLRPRWRLRQKPVAGERPGHQGAGMASITWDAEIAQIYDETYARLFHPDVLAPVHESVDRLQP
jgi:hypothetical protein